MEAIKYHGTCGTCARWFSSARRSTYCSQECRLWWIGHCRSTLRRRRRETSCRIFWGECSDCGVTVYKGMHRGPKVCDDCRSARRRANDAKKNARSVTLECPLCGDEYETHPAPSKRKNACPQHEWRQLRRSLATFARLVTTSGTSAILPTGEVRACAWCDHPHDGGAATCGAECEQALRYAKACWSAGRTYSCVATPTSCAECGTTFIARSSTSRFCGESCSRKASRRRRRPQRRAAKHQRRVLVDEGDNFTTREIAERDGWRCHLCGRKIPDRKYAARPDDLTLDHLIPVSDGGTHTRDNVRVAHNRCNYERSVGGEVQLLLVG